MAAVFTAPIRPDLVNFVHTSIAKNSRQAYAVSEKAGMQHSAESWGTGRAVARVPRISGGGTNRSGQGAFANMCRKGRMFAPTKTYRRWHRHVNINQRRYAVVSAVAASAVASLVTARGHRISEVPQLPLIVSSEVEAIAKTKDAVNVLEKIHAAQDVEKVKDSKQIRSGKGKMRNRRYTQRRGPLIVYKEDNGIVKAFRNIPGVELASVKSLNLLTLAPGGHMGRFIIWTEAAFQSLNEIFGTNETPSYQKHGYTLPSATITNADMSRIINSEEIQAVVKAIKLPPGKQPLRGNPLVNKELMLKLNPHFAARSESGRSAVKKTTPKAARSKKSRADAEFLKTLKE